LLIWINGLMKDMQNDCLKFPRDNMVCRGEFFASWETVTFLWCQGLILETVFQQRSAGLPIPV